MLCLLPSAAFASAQSKKSEAEKTTSEIVFEELRNLGDTREEVRAEAIKRLNARPASETLPVIQIYLDGLNLSMRANAADALAEMKLPPDMVVPLLIKSLSKDEVTAAIAFNALDKMGDRAFSSIVRVVVSDPDPVVREVAIYALLRKKISGTYAKIALVRALSDPERSVRGSAARALGEIKLSSYDKEDVVKELAKAMKDNDARVRRNATVSMGEIRIANDISLRALKEAMQDPDDWVKIYSINSLRGFGNKSKPVVKDVMKLTTDKNPDIAEASKKAVRKICGEGFITKSSC